jgi:hypothetical protein
MRIRTILTAAAGTAAAATGIAAVAMLSAPVAASAATLTSARPAMAWGSVELGNPLQYEKFLAIQNGSHHGTVDYTNFTYAEPGSGVWAPANSPQALTFTYAGTAYTHTLNGGLKLTALSPEKLAFTGSGSYNGQAGATWTISGQVKGNKISYTIKYTGTLSPGYTVTATGTIAADGSASGTATSSQGQALTWTEGPGAFASVLHYVAPVSSVHVKTGHNATFQFTIPANVAGLAGTKVTVTVHDGGRGAAHDTYAHGVTGGAQTAYPIIGGPGITVQK